MSRATINKERIVCQSGVLYNSLSGCVRQLVKCANNKSVECVPRI